jgi:mRNA interferase MazF
MVNQYDIYLVNLDPTIGHEIKKTRPCVVISPDEMNHNIKTVIIAPMTTKTHTYPTRIPITFQSKNGWIVLDQIRTVDNLRLVKKIGSVNFRTVQKLKQIINEMLVK